MDGKQIYELIPKVIAEVEAVGKDHENRDQHYKFRSIDDVYNAVNESLGKHQVSIFPTYTVIHNEITQTSKGSSQRNVLLQGTFKFTAPDGSFEQSTTFGEAIDYSDKAFNKAMSQAFKYALFQVFCIPTEEEKDTENESPPLPEPDKPVSNDNKKPEPSETAGYETISEKQAKRLFAIARGETKEDKSESVRMVIERYGYKSTKDISKADYQQISDDIENMPF